MTTETSVRSASINGVSLKYIDTGNGDPAIVFVHGWTCNRNDWRYQIEEFAGSHRVVALDQRGHGESEKPDQDYTIAGFADDLAAFIDELILERPVIVGHSMGGVIANSLARRGTGIARGVVLVDAPIMPAQEAQTGMLNAFLTGLRTPGYKNIARVFIEQACFNEASDPALKTQPVARIAEVPQRLMHTAMGSIWEEAEKHSGDMPVPTLFLLAATTTGAADKIKARFPNIELEEIDAAHFLQLERPKEVNDAIRGFIDRLTEVTR
ncbi:MAG: alpha/beta hydrolase [Chloroflexi bacterium]|nr:alpha/beta hydrolase [Chloroflexota bacterium]